MSIFLDWNYGVPFLLPPDPSEWLPRGHEAYFVANMILKLTRGDVLTTRDPELGGRPAYHPIMMLMVIVFAYLRGVRSSRKIARLLQENVAFKVLSCDQQPDFRTICLFRKNHHQWFENMLARTIHVAMVLRVIDFSATVVDGTPIQASANSKHNHTLPSLKALREKHLAALAAKHAKNMILEADTIDALEDQTLGDDVGSESMLRGLRDEKLDRIDAAIALAQALGKERNQAVRKAKSRIRRKIASKAKLSNRCFTPSKSRGKVFRIKSRRRLREDKAQKLLGKLAKVAIPKRPKVNTVDPDSKVLKAKNDGYMQGHQIIRATDLHSGMILSNHVSPTGGESRELWGCIGRVLNVTGLRKLHRVVTDAGYSGEPNLCDPLRTRVLEVLICQRGQEKAKSPIIQKQLKQNKKKKYWMRRRGIAEGSNAGTKEARGMRRFLLRGRLGAAIELALDAVAHNIMKLRSKFYKLTETKLTLALQRAAAVEI